MTPALVGTLFLVSWPPTWTPDDKQIVQSFSQQRPIGRYTVTAKTDVYNEGAVVIPLSHKDVSRPIVVLRPSTTPCDPYLADIAVFQEDGVRFRPHLSGIHPRGSGPSGNSRNARRRGYDQ